MARARSSVELTASRPAEHARAVVMVADEGYAPFAACLGASILDAHPERGFDVCVLTTAVDEPPGAEGLRVLHARGDNPFAHRPLAERRSHASYLCLMLPRLLGADYGRILYLDCDIHLERGDLGALLALDLHGQAVGAVRDHTQWRTPSRVPEEFRRLGWGHARYLNSGVLLYDAGRFEAEGWLDRMVGVAADPRLARGYTRNDQSAINLALRGRWTELSPVWNWQHARATRHAAEHAEPRLVHFIGPRKPWLDHGRDLPPRYRARPHAFLARHVPDHPALASLDPVARAEPARLGASYLRHWRRWRATEAYLARFPLETTTHPPEGEGWASGAG